MNIIKAKKAFKNVNVKRHNMEKEMYFCDI